MYRSSEETMEESVGLMEARCVIHCGGQCEGFVSTVTDSVIGATFLSTVAGSVIVVF